MDAQYYLEYFKKYADSTEEDAVKVKSGAIEMEIVDGITTNLVDKVAHRASIILDLNMYRNNKDDYVQDICYVVCTDDCEIQSVVDKCRDIINSNIPCDIEDDVETLTRLRMILDKQVDCKTLGYVSDEVMRAYVVREQPEYNQLKSNIDYILYDLLDVLDLTTSESKVYAYKHREQLIRPVMELVRSSGDIMLIQQIKQVYDNWMGWELIENVS